MAITTLDGLIAAPGWDTTWMKTGARTTVAANWYTLIDLAGNPGAGALAGTSVAAGVVPTKATAGMPQLGPAFGGGNTGYLTDMDFGSSVACRIRMYDLLWKAGAYTFNANQALTGQPSFAGRVPGAPTYDGLQIWYEQVTTGTGIQSVTVTYTDQINGAGRSTGAFSIGVAGVVGRMHQIPLQAGDASPQLITNVQGTVASAGTFNILVMRRLWSGRVRIINDGDTEGPSKVGLPILYETSALYPIIAPDSTAIGLPELQISLANG